MARFEITGLEDLYKQLEKVSANVVKISKKAVDSASPLLVKSVKSEIHSKTRPHEREQLVNSIEATKAIENSYGVFSATRPRGTDSKGMRNGEKLAYLEYGNGRSEPKYIMTPATNKVQTKVVQTMQRIFDDELEKIAK